MKIMPDNWTDLFYDRTVRKNILTIYG